MEYNAGQFDIAVIGAGHAGVEAALAAARLGLRTICFTINLDAVGNMPCNPSIGGTGKGHLVRELDALGGEMGKAADRCAIQFRMLNRGKGPAVHSPRAQIDRREYQKLMKHTLERQPRLSLRQAEIIDIGVENGAVSYVKTRTGAIFHTSAVIICAGTYLNARTIVGEAVQDGGPDGMFAAEMLVGRLQELGLNLRRFKTGTPPRINAQTVDFTKLEVQHGDNPPKRFSFVGDGVLDIPLLNRRLTDDAGKPGHDGTSRDVDLDRGTSRDVERGDTKDAKRGTLGTASPTESAVCWLAYSNEQTHDVVRANLHRSPMYSGVIEGTGTRYCPSFEDKVVRFAEKDRHQLFLEPTGLDTEELYLQGFSSSLPEEVQVKMLRTIPGMAQAEIMRPAYAIEYDCIDPLELNAALECKKIAGLYGAGQFCGSSGYEEAAVQGFVAGVNAALKLRGEDPLIIRRSDGYIGALIDDLVTKGTNEPYRIMTSRSEYRLLHRQDNADIRMSALGRRIGLISAERHQQVLEKYEAVAREIARLKNTYVPPSESLKAILESAGEPGLKSGASLANLLRRPKLSYDMLAPHDTSRPVLGPEITEQVEISIRYEGYIDRQARHLRDFEKMENHPLPEDLDYSTLNGLRLEAREKLNAVRPANLGQASRVSGVSPADIAVIMVWLGS